MHLQEANPQIARFLALSAPALLALLAGCETTSGGHNLGPANTAQGAIGLKTPDGLPVGGWVCVYNIRNVNNTVTIRNVLNIGADGNATELSTFDCQYDAGWTFSSGKFAGLRRISWTTHSTYHSAKRVGDEIYLYSRPSDRGKLVGSNPPGHSLRDFMTLGGLLTQPADELAGGTAGGVTILKVQGKNLVMENSEDGNRWLYKATANAR